jgi:hypothetical protein
MLDRHFLAPRESTLGVLVDDKRDGGQVIDRISALRLGQNGVVQNAESAFVGFPLALLWHGVANIGWNGSSRPMQCIGKTPVQIIFSSCSQKA